jgi:hypothetical protein
MNIMATLEKGVSTKGFAEAVQTAFVSHTGPPLLRDLLTIYNAHRRDLYSVE